MAKRAIAILIFALAWIGILPVFSPFAQDYGLSIRRTFPGIGMIVPKPARRSQVRKSTLQFPFYYYDNRSRLFSSRRQVGRSDLVNSLRARGFRDIGPIQQRGTALITEATGPKGERVRLVINSQTGGIDGVRVIGLGK